MHDVDRVDLIGSQIAGVEEHTGCLDSCVRAVSPAVALRVAPPVVEVAHQVRPAGLLLHAAAAHGSHNPLQMLMRKHRRLDRIGIPASRAAWLEVHIHGGVRNAPDLRLCGRPQVELAAALQETVDDAPEGDVLLDFGRARLEAATSAEGLLERRAGGHPHRAHFAAGHLAGSVGHALSLGDPHHRLAHAAEVAADVLLAEAPHGGVHRTPLHLHRQALVEQLIHVFAAVRTVCLCVLLRRAHTGVEVRLEVASVAGVHAGRV
mmetsp:Transcript_95115/g.264510  ORF Transcript_95115/g.264510 Transcript_95115/m.264510 type:complete len:263 (+) Transcript_95115:988-1776(+)